MLDHGQLGPATPAARTPATSRRPSALLSHRPSMNQTRPNVATISESRPRRQSLLSFGDTLTMSPIGDSGSNADGDAQSKASNSASPSSRRGSAGERSILRNLPEVVRGSGDEDASSSALDDGSDEESPPTSFAQSPTGLSNETAKLIGRRMSDAVLSPLTEVKEGLFENIGNTGRAPDDARPSLASTETLRSTTFISPVDLAAELYANPKLAALRSPLAIGMTPMQPASKVTTPVSAPILANPKCSGYFVEPVRDLSLDRCSVDLPVFQSR